MQKRALISLDGNPASTNPGRYQYTGQTWLSDAGLYHYKNRAYNPRLMRFMQADPIGHSGGINLYAYVGGDSVNLIDPLGLSPSSLDSPDPDGQPDGCPFSMYCNDREFAVWRISIEAAQFYNQSLGFDIKVAVAMTGRIQLYATSYRWTMKSEELRNMLRCSGDASNLASVRAWVDTFSDGQAMITVGGLLVGGAWGVFGWPPGLSASGSGASGGLLLQYGPGAKAVERERAASDALAACRAG